MKKRDALTGCHRTMCQLHGSSPLMLITGDRAKYKALHMITMTLEEVLHGLLYSQPDSRHYACWDFVRIHWWRWPLKEKEEKRTYLQYCLQTLYRACQFIGVLKKKALFNILMGAIIMLLFSLMYKLNKQLHELLHFNTCDNITLPPVFIYHVMLKSNWRYFNMDFYSPK